MSAGANHGYALRLSVTDRCQFRCQYCLPATGVRFLPRRETLTDSQLVDLVDRIHRAVGLDKVRITGGEPLLRPNLTELVRALAGLGIRQVAMTTNAQLLASHADALADAGLQRINISLDSLDPATFREMSRGGDLQRTLDGIDAAIAAGLTPVKLNTVVMRGINDHEATDLAAYAMARGCILRFLELMPIGPAVADFDERFVPGDETRARLAERFALTDLPVERGATSRNLAIRDRDGRTGQIGFITASSKPFCAGCKRLRLTATGQLVGCLARSAGVDLRRFLESGDSDALGHAIGKALASKRHRPTFTQSRHMAGLGG